MVTSTSRRLRSEKSADLDAGPARWPADGWSLGSLAASGPRLAWAAADTLTFNEIDLPVARGAIEEPSVPVQRPKKTEAPAPEHKLTPWERHLAAVAARAEAAKEASDRVRAATETRPAPHLRSVPRPTEERATPSARANRPGRHPAGRQASVPRPRPAAEEPHVEWAKDRSLEPMGPRTSFASTGRPRIKVTGVRRPLLPHPAERPTHAPAPAPIARRIAELPRHPAVAGGAAPRRAAAARQVDEDTARWTVIDLTTPEPVLDLPRVAATAAVAHEVKVEAPIAVLRLEPLNRKESRENRETRETRETREAREKETSHASRVRPTFPPLARRASGDGFTLSPGHSRA